MNIFVSGGCKNGKSFHAQHLAKDMADKLGVPLYYVATMRPVDEEDQARIRRHIAERDGWGFITLEQERDICECLEKCEVESIADRRYEKRYRGVFLLDSVTALLSNEMFDKEGIHPEASLKVKEDLVRFAQLTGNTVFVSDYIYSDAKIYDGLTEDYRRGLAGCDKALAQVCEQVLEVTYGVVKNHK